MPICEELSYVIKAKDSHSKEGYLLGLFDDDGFCYDFAISYSVFDTDRYPTSEYAKWAIEHHFQDFINKGSLKDVSVVKVKLTAEEFL